MTMTSKERVRNAINHKPVDKAPAAFHSVANVAKKLMTHYGFDNMEQLYDKFDIDIRYAHAKCIKSFPDEVSENGNKITTSFWGFKNEVHSFGTETYSTTFYFPLNDVTTVEEVDNYNWPQADWFDYTPITDFCRNHKDKAIVVGHEGPFQNVTSLVSMDKFFMMMIDYPEVAQRILDKMVEFELAYYEQMFIAGEGLIDILRTHDDYGTQISMLFSTGMWEDFFQENTKKLVELSHKHNVLFQQHSCGAVAPIIPYLIECGVDSIEPLQPVDGLFPEQLQENFGGKICFHGGIDTQDLLPNGTVEEVKKETERYLNTLNKNGGYILMASQAFESDVPIENIEAVYSVDRTSK